ncbi:hypothetical protein AVEN_249146-1 [Araneus ventricosus]|uniref:Uncharacterized protein n=1 Tax=Araneus ventricosus TaxID=182803 RepID=A0A4Y2D405_ARAVE|nr:hypothetical protein AVEN_249146-1 [Araneus ventricosus]
MLKCDRCRYAEERGVGSASFLRKLEEAGISVLKAGGGRSRCCRGSERPGAGGFVVSAERPVNDLPKSGHSPSIFSNLFGGLLGKPFPFSAHQIWWAIHRSDCAKCTYGQPDPLG